MTSTTSNLVATRESLHQVAEHVLAAAQFAETGHVGLACVPGGFTTRWPLSGDRRLMVIRTDLVIADAVARRRTPLSTVGAAAAVLGIPAGLPASAYQPATELTPETPLLIDPDSAGALFRWYGLADRALRVFAEEVGGGPVRPTLWPEHFDLAISVDAVNYGASPGDHHIQQPYLYVGPHAGPPSADDFWNAEFGAVLTIADVASPDDALAFYRRGRSLLAA